VSDCITDTCDSINITGMYHLKVPLHYSFVSKLSALYALSYWQHGVWIN